MKRILLLLGMVLALAMTAMANAEPEYPDPGITSPTAGELIYENTLSLAAVDPSVAGSTEDLDWAVVTDDGVGAECTGEIHFNRNNSAYDYEAGAFGAELDIRGLEAGEYCFVFNTFNRNAPDGVRLVQWFYIVDDYAKVGGVIDLSEGAPKKGNGTHSMEGVVGIAGSYGTVGSVTINYRELDEVCTFTPGSFGLNAAPGIGVYDNLRGDLNEFNNSCGGTARLLVLDRDASTVYPRGAIYVDKAVSGYGIDLDPNDNSGPGNWVPMLRGNNHVGTR